MATYNTVKFSSFSPDYSYLSCDICGSDNIIETPQGFVCQKCGLELELQKLQYDRPYNDDIIQYAKGLGRTQIGNKRERAISSFSRKLNRLNRHTQANPYEDGILQRTREEISRLFSCLKFEEYSNPKQMVYHKFKKVWPELRSGTKYHNVKKLTAIIIFFCLKIEGIWFHKSQIINNSDITNKEFNDFYTQVVRYFPRYKTRNRQEYILQEINNVAWHFNLGRSFFLQSENLLYKLWEGIKNTTDHVIAGVISSISTLCSKTFRNKVRIDSICRHLGIRMSTVQGQVKKKINTKFNIGGFVSLVKSAGLLQKAFETLGFIEKKIETSQEGDKVNLVFGNATQIFNYHDDIDYYFFAFKSGDNNTTAIYIQVNHPLMDIKNLKKSTTQHNVFLSFTVVRYSKGKDPPLRKI